MGKTIKVYNEKINIINNLVDTLACEGVNYIAHSINNLKQVPTIFFSNQEWANIYSKNGYASEDKLRKISLDGIINCFFWDTLHLNAVESSIMQQRAAICGIKNGFNIILKKEKDISIFAIASDKVNLQFEKFCSHNLANLVNYACLIDQIMHASVEQGQLFQSC